MNPLTPKVASSSSSTTEDSDQNQASVVPVSRLVPSWKGLFIDKASLSHLLNLSVLRPTLLLHACCNVGSRSRDLCVHSVRVINKVVYFVDNCNDTCCSY